MPHLTDIPAGDLDKSNIERVIWEQARFRCGTCGEHGYWIGRTNDNVPPYDPIESAKAALKEHKERYCNGRRDKHS